MRISFKHREDYFYLANLVYILGNKPDFLQTLGAYRYIKNLLKEKFISVNFLENRYDQLRFNFSEADDEAFFLLWSSEWIDLT